VNAYLDLRFRAMLKRKGLSVYVISNVHPREFRTRSGSMIAGWPITKPTKRALKTCHTGVEHQQGVESDRLSPEKFEQHSRPRK
jgi:nitrite reductase/ring-hydroxylating ferredoxin subunit